MPDVICENCDSSWKSYIPPIRADLFDSLDSFFPTGWHFRSRSTSISCFGCYIMSHVLYCKHSYFIYRRRLGRGKGESGKEKMVLLIVSRNLSQQHLTRIKGLRDWLRKNTGNNINTTWLLKVMTIPAIFLPKATWNPSIKASVLYIGECYRSNPTKYLTCLRDAMHNFNFCCL